MVEQGECLISAFAGVIEKQCVVSASKRNWKVAKTALLSAANIDLRNVVTTFPHPTRDSCDVDVRI
jgi:hypothetical protein